MNPLLSFSKNTMAITVSRIIYYSTEQTNIAHKCNTCVIKRANPFCYILILETVVRMSRFWTLIFLTFTLLSCKLSEAKHHPNKLPSSAAVVGTVYCDTCFHQDFPSSNHFIAGATVAVECKKSTSSTPYFRQEAKTNSRGEFRVELPFSVSKHVTNIRGCSVALIRSNEPFCAAAATSSSLRLKSRSQGKQIFSAGFFTFKPLVCDQKQSTDNVKNDRKLSTKMAFFLPPNPLLPPPSLIPPVLPTPPPSLFPPIFPTPPPSVIPPILPTPPSSPAPFLPIPQIPGLIPSPPPPPPPSFPVPLPPLPFLPPPLIPGGPPAKVSSQVKTSHP